MSKYKYSSLLSSQYRQVFKSYHSLDRTEQELKDNLSKSLHKRIRTEINQVETENSCLHYQKTQFQIPNQRPETYLYYKTQPKYAVSAGNFVDRKNFETYSTKFGYTEKLSNISNKNQNKSLLCEQGFDPVSQEVFSRDKSKENTSFHEPNQFKNYELKMKVSEINKRRSDIKLKARVGDVEKIKKKYQYLNENNGKIQILQSHNSQKQNEPSEPIQRSPLIETCNNRISQKKYCQLTKERAKAFVSKVNYDQNIQTPHFHQTEVKKSTVQPSLISLKLQNLVKNTFTDRY